MRRGEDPDSRLARVLKDIANAVQEGIEMEEDHPSRNANGKMPILDMEVWMENGIVLYTHYQKKVSSKKVMNAMSAQSASCKKSVHVQELLRRMLNTSPRLDWKVEVAPVLTEYMGRMLVAGYSEGYRKNVLQHALRIIDKMKKEEQEGVRPLYRAKEWEADRRRIDKKRKKHTWSTKGGSTAPIMIPSTPGGELANMLREVAQAEAEVDIKFNIIETGGRTVKSELQRSNPTATAGCTDALCIACKEGRGRGGNCRRSNITYEVECHLCPSDDRSVYVGESSRNLYTRGDEHSKKYGQRAEGSFLTKHQMAKHQGIEAEYSAKVTGQYNDCLTRQVTEGVFIRRCEANIMNTKAEWHQPPIWKVQSEILRG